MNDLAHIANALIAGEDTRTCRLVEQALTADFQAADILDKGLLAGMAVIGEQFKNHEIFLPDVLLAARAMTRAMEILQPYFIKGAAPSKGRIVMGTVQGDLHDIGKNLVAVMLRGNNVDVIDLGNNVAPEQFVQAAIDHQAGIIGMSTLLTTTMPVMRRVVEMAAQQADKRIKILIGGAPVSAEYAREIGATAYAYDAGHAVQVVGEMLSGEAS